MSDIYTATGPSTTRETKRAYDAWVDGQFVDFQQVSLATLQTTYPAFPLIMPLVLQPQLVHRKVWAYFNSDSLTYFIDVDLVFFLQRAEVFRIKFMQWESTGLTGPNWSLGSSYGPNPQGMYAGSMTTVRGVRWIISPQLYNIAADSCALDIGRTTGPAAVFDGVLQVLSTAGI